MKKTFASSLAVLGIVTVLGAGCMDTTGTPTTSSSTMTPDIASLGNTVTETNSKLNFSITFPKDIFQLTSFGTDNHPCLTSQYYITDDSCERRYESGVTTAAHHRIFIRRIAHR
jgi:hypothetical protein